MANVRGLLREVKALKIRQALVSPIVALYGSIDAFGAADAERLEQRDFAQVIAALHRWERDGVGRSWHHGGHRVRERGL